MDGTCTVRVAFALALLGVGACAAVERTGPRPSEVHFWKSPPPGADLFHSATDAQPEGIKFLVQLPEKFTPESSLCAEVTNEGSESIFVSTLDGKMILGSEAKYRNGFFGAGGNDVYCREGTELTRLLPGESIRGSMLVGELSGRWHDPSPVRMEGAETVESRDSVEGEFRLTAEFHTREHDGTSSPPDCDMRHFASASFIVPYTEWTR